MQYSNCKSYVEVKTKRYITEPNENTILRKAKQPKPLRTPAQVIIETQKNEIKRLLKNKMKNYRSNQIQKRKTKIKLKNQK